MQTWGDAAGHMTFSFRNPHLGFAQFSKALGTQSSTLGSSTSEQLSSTSLGCGSHPFIHLEAFHCKHL